VSSTSEKRKNHGGPLLQKEGSKRANRKRESGARRREISEEGLGKEFGHR